MSRKPGQRLPSSAPESAGVRIDPQLIYAIPFGIGLLVERWFPTALLPSAVATTVGVAVLFLGIVLAAAAVVQLRRVRTTLQPWEATTSLVTDGPYRISRNPIYLAYTLVYLGAGVWTNSLWPVALLPIIIATMRLAVIAKEETYLEARFGEIYREYRSRVRRWL